METPASLGSSDTFEYSQLRDSSSDIRLAWLELSLFRAPNGDEIPECTLIHTSLVEAPPYIALSYAWGDANDQLNILLNGKRKSVTRNLATYLYQTVSNVKKNQPRSTYPLWVDAICINQNDNTEKSQQVQLMGTIYSKAENVTIWLGPSSQDSHLALDFLKELANSYANIVEEHRKSPSPSPWAPLLALLPSFKRDKSTQGVERWLITILYQYDATLKPLRSLVVDRPWWRRVWVRNLAGHGFRDGVQSNMVLLEHKYDQLKYGRSNKKSAWLISVEYVCPVVKRCSRRTLSY